MLSIQKSPTDKTELGYVAPPPDIPSTSTTVFVKLTVPKPPLTVVDKGKDVIGGDIPVTQKPPIIRRPPIFHHCGLSRNIRPQCSLLKAQRSKVKKEVPRQANFSTRPLAQHQAPQHQRHQQRFVPTNQNGKPKTGKPKTNKSRHFMKKS